MTSEPPTPADASNPSDRPAASSARTAPIPVYNCPAYLSPPDANGQILARCATLPDVTARGANQREALARLVELFKQTLVGYRAAELEIPFCDPPVSPAPGEKAVYIAVHL